MVLSTEDDDDASAGEMTNRIAISDSQPSWFTPKRLLVIFCVINMLNYVDRGTIASNGVNGSLETCTETGVCTAGTGIQGDFNLNYFEDGLLSSAFMVGLLIASPIFASLAKSHNPFRLIGVGLSVWTVAAAGCGCSFNFWSITICRMLVGVGEASFISLAAPFIDDNAPLVRKQHGLRYFTCAYQLALQLAVYGGLVGSYLNWRFAFLGEAILMLPFAILGFVMKPLQLKGFSHAGLKKDLTSIDTVSSESEESQVLHGKDGVLIGYEDNQHDNSTGTFLSKVADQFAKFWKDIKVLLFDKVYVTNCLGYISYNFVIGAYSYWGPKAGYDIYHMSDPDIVFGGVTIVCGIFGTLAGGYILDSIDSTITNAFKLLSGATFLGAIFCFSAFCSSNLYVFLALFSIGELLVFATQDYVNNWRESALILTSVLFLAAGIWFIGIFLNTVDKYDEDSGHHVTEPRRSDLTPLLEGSTTEMSQGSVEP